MANLVDRGAISGVGTGREGKMSLDLNKVSARYLWDIQRADLEAAVQLSLTLRREWRRDMIPLHPPASASRWQS